jgi:hypothetical protein
MNSEKKTKEFDRFCFALDESNDTSDTALSLFVIRGITESFEMDEKLATLKSIRSSATREDLFLNVCETIKELELSWKKGKTGRRTGLMDRIGREMGTQNSELYLELYFVIQQQLLWG